jgi:hypothetical protein
MSQQDWMLMRRVAAGDEQAVAEWLADNPDFLYKEVTCPDALVQRTTMDRRSVGDVQNNCGG